MFTRRPAAHAAVSSSTAAGNPNPDAPTGWLWVVFALAHIPLALLMQAQSLVAYVHAVITFAIGMWWALSSNQLYRVVWVAAYIAGSEVLWRMSTDALPWESGKYMVLVLSVAALLSTRGLKSVVVPGLLFAVLLPSAVLTVSAFDYAVWRAYLSFNLAGPLALAMFAGLCSFVRLPSGRLVPLLLLLVAPTVGIAGLVVKSIVTAQAITFTMGSNFALSGGFGPNQVSLALGLGAVAALLCVIETGMRRSIRLILFVVMIWLVAQSALTFSRGGFFGALIASIIAIGWSMTVPQMRRRMIWVVTLMLVVGSGVVWPMLLQFTDGKIAARFQETNTTNREVYGMEDLKAWEEHPILGIGPGLSKFEHFNRAQTHTEFTRLLAEHGTFGAFAILMMAVACVRNVSHAPSGREKGLVASAMVWSFLYMTNAAMRTVAPALMFGLGFCAFEPSRPAAPSRRVLRPGRRGVLRPHVARLAAS